MNPFEDPGQPKYAVSVEWLAGLHRLDAQGLLDILERRAMLVLRANAVPGVNAHTVDFNSGRYHEIQELYKAIKSHVDK